MNDACVRLDNFVDRACGLDTGFVWTANGNVYPLRAPRRDADGIRGIEWNKPLSPLKRPRR